MNHNQTFIPYLEQTLLVVDPRVGNYEQLLPWVNQEVELLTLAVEKDGVEQINRAIAHRLGQPGIPPISSIHIVAHGAPGRLQLGNTDLSLSTLNRYAWSLQTWFANLPGGLIPSLVLYGCNVAAGDAGAEFLEKLYHLTGASIRASRSRVGHVSQGGDWNLDICQGTPAPPLIFDAQVADAYVGVLPTYTDGDSYYRVIDSATDTFVDISGTGTRIAKMTDQNSTEPKFDANDDGEQGLDLPFTFNYYGTNYNTLTVGVNGGLILGTKQGVVSPTHAELSIQDTQTQDPIPAIFPFWTDLMLTISGAGDVYYKTDGTAGSRTFTVQWNNIVHKEVADGVTFQVVLHEGSNEVTFAYQDTSFNNPAYDDGKVSTVGLSGEDGIQYSKDETGLSGIKTIRFVADPRLVNNAITIDEGEQLTLTEDHLKATDFDAVDGTIITYTISNLQHGHFERSGVTVMSFTQDDIADGRIKFIHDKGESAPSFDFTLKDQHPETVESQAIAAQITFNNLNDAPVLENVTASLSFQENTINSAASLIDADVTLSDPDSLNFNGGQLLVTYTSTKGLEDQLGIRTDGLVSFTSGVVYYDGTEIGTASGLTNGEDGKNLVVLFNNNANATKVEAVIENLTYQNISDTPQSSRSVKIEVTDGDGSTSIAQSVAIAVTANNDNPIVSVPDTSTTPLELDEEHVLTFTGAQLISITDVDAGSNPVRVILTATDGIVALGSLSNVTIKNGSNNSSTVTLEGTVANLNAALNNTQFTPNTHFNGHATVTVEVRDQGNSGTPLSPLMDQATIDIAVKAINDAPINTVPTAQIVDEDTNLVFSGTKLISIADADVNESVDKTLNVTLSVNHGTVTLSQTSGLSLISGSSGESTMQFVGTVAAINAALNGIIYRGDQDFNGTDELTITTNDQGNTSAAGNELIDIDTVAITVDPINDAPVNTVPATAQTVDEDTNLVFNSTNGNAISVTDIDALQENKNIQVALSVNSGILTLNSTSGLTFGTGDGTQDKSIRFTGLVADINAALNGLIYRGDANFDGADTLTISTNDLGNVGKSGIIKNNIGTVAIDLTPVNDAPTVSGFAQAISFNEQNVNAGFQVLDSSVNLHDVDSDDFDQGLLTVTSNAPLEDQLSIQNQGTSSGQIGVSGTTVTFGGTHVGTINADGSAGTLQVSLNANANKDAVEALLKNLTYKNTSDTPVSDRTISFELKDGDGGTTTFSSNVTVNAHNDAPVLSKNLLQINEDQILTLNANNLVATDVDSNDNELTFVVANARNGVFLVEGIELVAGVDAIEFTQQQLIDNKVEFQHDGGEDAPYYEIRVKDEANLTVAQAVDMTFVKVNDAPTLSGLTHLFSLSGTQATQSPNLIDTDVSFADIDSLNLGGGYVSIAYSNGGGPEDQLSVQTKTTPNNSTIRTGTQIFFGSTLIGDVDATQNGVSGQALQINLNSSATVAAVQALIQGLTYQNTSSTPSENRTLSVKVNDGTDTSEVSQVLVTIAPENDPPEITAPTQITTNEDEALTLTSGSTISVDDPDAGDTSPLKVKLTATKSTLTLSGRTGLTFSEGDGTADATLTFQGTIVNINNALAGLVVSPDADANGSATIQVDLDDLGNTGGGGPKTASHTISLNITAINDRPQIAMLANHAVNEDTDLVFDGSNQLTISDLDSSGAIVQATLSVTNGLLTLNGDVNGLDVLEGTEIDDTVVGKTLVIRGTVADINGAMENMLYRADANFNGSDTLSIEVDDLGNTGDGGALKSQKNLVITVNAINDAPINTTTSSQTVREEALLTFSDSLGTTLRIDDVDLGESANSAQVMMVVESGVLTLAQTTGLSFLNGDGTADAAMTFVGTPDAINAAMNGLTYQGNRDFFGSDTLKITTSDRGNTGQGGVLLNVDEVAITVENVNDAPIISGEPPISVVEGKAYSFTPTAKDVDGDRLTFTILNKPSWATFNTDTGTLSGNPVEANIGLTSGVVIQVSDGIEIINLSPFSLEVLDSKIRGGGTSDSLVGGFTNDIILGLDGDDSLQGGDGDDTMYGDSGNDLLFGENGNDTLYGSIGNDQIDGGNGADVIYGEAGKDKIFGQSGRDTLYGGADKDVLKGGKDNDRLYGDADEDKLFGDDGNDLLLGGDGNDLLSGGLGDDNLVGFKGNDKLVGGSDNDILDGGQGKDKHKGGSGKDIFVMNTSGYALIRDYKDGLDKLAIAGKNGKKFFNKLGIVDQGRHTLIEFGDDTIGKLKGVDASLITKSDFTRV